MAGFGFSIGDIVLVSNLALSIYSSSKQAGKEFWSIADDAASLQTSLRTLREEIERPKSLINRSSGLQRGELSALMVSCKADLEDIEEKLANFKSLRKSKPRTRDKLRFTPGTQAEIRSRIARNSDRLNRFLNGLHTHALGRVEGNTEQHFQSFGEIVAKLDKIHQDVLQRKRNASILTDMNELHQELIDDNITEIDVETNEDEIAEWLTYIRGTANLQDMLADITKNPWNEQSRVTSLTTITQSNPKSVEIDESGEDEEIGTDGEDEEESGTDDEDDSAEGSGEEADTEGEKNRNADVESKHIDTSGKSQLQEDCQQPHKPSFQVTVEDYNSENSNENRELNSDRDGKTQSKNSSNELKTDVRHLPPGFDATPKKQDPRDDASSEETKEDSRNYEWEGEGENVKRKPSQSSKGQKLHIPYTQPPLNSTLTPTLQNCSEGFEVISDQYQSTQETWAFLNGIKFPRISHDAYSIRCGTLSRTAHSNPYTNADKTELSTSNATVGPNSRDEDPSILPTNYSDIPFQIHQLGLYAHQKPPFNLHDPHHGYAHNQHTDPSVTYIPDSQNDESGNAINSENQVRELFRLKSARKIMGKVVLVVTLCDILKGRRNVENTRGEIMSIRLRRTLEEDEKLTYPGWKYPFLIKVDTAPYDRVGDDLYYDIEIELGESLCGFERTVPLVGGDKWVEFFPGPAPQGSTTRIKGQGMPTSLKAVPGARGDLVVRVCKIKYPPTLTKEQRKKLSEIFGVILYAQR